MVRLLRLLVRIYRTLVLGFDTIPVPPLPVVVAVVVDLLDRDRCFRRNVVGEILGGSFDPVGIVFFSEAFLSFAIFG